MENRETTTGQAAQCKKTDWFKKIYGDMIDDEESRSITFSDGTRLELNLTGFNMYMNMAQSSTSSTRRAARPTTMEDELVERIFIDSYGNRDEVTNIF